MSTINKILKREWYTIDELIDCEFEWICNGMWAKNWFQITDYLRWLKYFNSKKEKKLLRDMDLISDIHDIKWLKPWCIFAFLKSNYVFCIDIVSLFYWTNTINRILLFSILFIWLNIWWVFNYKWSCINVVKKFIDKYIP